MFYRVEVGNSAKASRIVQHASISGSGNSCNEEIQGHPKLSTEYMHRQNPDYRMVTCLVCVKKNYASALQTKDHEWFLRVGQSLGQDMLDASEERVTGIVGKK